MWRNTESDIISKDLSSIMTNLKSVIKKKETTVNAQTQIQQHYSTPLPSNHKNTKALNKAIKKKEKELMSHKSHAPSSAHTAEEHKIEPPKLHRDMRLICDVFRITNKTHVTM